MTGITALLYGYILQEDGIHDSTSDLALFFGVSERGIAKALKWLKDEEYIFTNSVYIMKKKVRIVYLNTNKHDQQ